jgi:hypothetical protein
MSTELRQLTDRPMNLMSNAARMSKKALKGGGFDLFEFVSWFIQRHLFNCIV